MIYFKFGTGTSTKQPIPISKRIDSLQWLRAIAAFWVLFTHVFQRLEEYPMGYAFSGQWGVDVFFILSGFIIFYTTKDGSNWKRFAKKRVFRIFPLYIFCLIAYYVFFHVTEDTTLSVLQWIQNIIMMPFSDAIGFHSLVVGQAWSTCYELYFYFLLMALLMLHVQKRWLVLILLALFVIGMIISRFDYITQFGFSRYLLSLVGSRHILMFCIGVVIALLYTKFSPAISRYSFENVVSIAILFVIVGYAFVLLSRYSYYNSLIFSSIVFGVFLVSQPVLSKMGCLNRLMTYLGDISFSIYLVHTLIIRLLIIIGIDTLGELLPLTIVVVIAISSFTYTFIEQPFIKLAKS